MEDGQQAHVRVDVLDPGWAPDGNVVDPTGDYCYRRRNVRVDVQEPHVWAPATIGGDGSTWFCSRCRRIERRTVIVDDPVLKVDCPQCGHAIGDHVGGCRRCGCREIVIVENP